MITIKQTGSFVNTEKLLRKAGNMRFWEIMNRYGVLGVNALSAATPIDTGHLAQSWSFEIVSSNLGASIHWTNSDVVDGTPIAIILQYGHGTGTGGYVEGRDYINPAIRPIFDKLAEDLWREVVNP